MAKTAAHVMVDCQPSNREPYRTETPVLVIEVVSPATRAALELDVAMQGIYSGARR
jgi:hypothetical protein